MERFGVPQLDRLLPNIPAGASMVLVHDPGVEAEPFLYQAAHHHMANGRDVVYVALSRSPAHVRRAMREYGFEPDGRMHFVDGHGVLVGSVDPGAYPLAPDGSDLARVLERAARDHPGAVVLLDPLSALIDRSSFDAFRERFPAIREALKLYSMSASLFARWPYAEDVGTVLDAFEAVVRLRVVEDRLVVGQYFHVERLAWARVPTGRPVLYRTLRPGGIFAYIPKIVVTGPFHAGKTTLVHTLSDAAVSVNRLGTTVALDHGHVTIDGLTADIFGTPGQERFDPILKIIAGQALGVILVVDSTQPDTFGRARDMLEATWKQGLPAIIAANKQDAPGAKTPDEVKRLLAGPPHVRVVGCVAGSRESAMTVLRDLLDQILKPEGGA